MVARPSSHEQPPNDYSPDDLRADLDRLEAGIAALRPEPVNVEDYERHWLDLLAEYERIYRRLGRSWAGKGGG